VRAGETGLFEVIMRRYNQRLYRVARSILRDDAEAEDVTQQAYVNAYRHLDQFANRATFSTWLTKIAVHDALARARRRGRFNEQEVDDDWDGDTMGALTSPGPDPERQAFAGELRALLESAIEALPEHYRAVFVHARGRRHEHGGVRGVSRHHRGNREDAPAPSANVAARHPVPARGHRECGGLFVAAPRCDRVVDSVFAQIEALDQSSPPKAT
jgi:RNA polymerase sigma factor, sigma-70 family